jgi:hypothetical protein
MPRKARIDVPKVMHHIIVLGMNSFIAFSIDKKIIM